MYDGQLLCTGQIPNTSLLHTMDSRTIDPKSGMVRVSHTMQILALKEKDTTFDEGYLDGLRSTSPTLCGTIPPSPVDTLVELDSTFPPSILSSAPASGMFAKSVVDTSYEPNTFVYPHLFAIGDAADAFGAIKAGHTAYHQGDLAARNVIKLIKGNAGTLEAPLQGLTFPPGAGKMEGDSGGAEKDLGEDVGLGEYVPGLPKIKISLGLVSSSLHALHLFTRLTGFLNRRSQHMKWLVSWVRKMKKPTISAPLSCGKRMGTRILTMRGCGYDCFLLDGFRCSGTQFLVSIAGVIVPGNRCE